MRSNVLRIADFRRPTFSPKSLIQGISNWFGDTVEERIEALCEAFTAEHKDGLCASTKKGRRFTLRLVRPEPEIGSRKWRRQHDLDYLD